MAQIRPVYIIVVLGSILLLVAMLAGVAYFMMEMQVQPPIGSGGVLFSDDFSTAENGWETWQDAKGSWVGHQSGGLRFVIGEPYFDYWSRLPERYADVYLEVDALKIGGPDDNSFGLLCRMHEGSYYAFLITSDGYFGILKIHEGAYTFISDAGGLAYSEVIYRGQASNRIGAFCSGDHLLLAVNGEILAQADDVDLPAGQVGLFAGTTGTPGVDILFDNFVIFQP